MGKSKRTYLDADVEPQMDDDADMASDASSGEEKAVYSDSSSEPEDWGDFDEDKDWKIEIVGEEIHSVTGKSIFETKWIDWEGRKDGTTTTWQKEQWFHDSGLMAIVDQWRQDLTKDLRKSHMLDSLSIVLWDDLNLHDSLTRENDQAWAAKLEISQSNKQKKLESNTNFLQQLNENSRGLEDPIPDSSSQRRSSRISGASMSQSGASMSQSGASMSQSPVSNISFRLPSSRTLSSATLPTFPLDSAARQSASHDSTISTSGRKRKANTATSPPNSSSTTGTQNAAALPHTSDRPAYLSRPSVTSQPKRSGQSNAGERRVASTSSSDSEETTLPPRGLKRKRSSSSTTISSSSSVAKLLPPSATLPSSSSIKKPSSSNVMKPSSHHPPVLTKPSASSSRVKKPFTTSSSKVSTALKPRLKALSNEWTIAASQSNAATVIFVNDLDDCDEPPVELKKFEYLENAYKRGPGVPPLERISLIFCKCEAGCSEQSPSSSKGKQKSTGTCSCMELFAQEYSGKSHPYTRDGLVGIVERNQEVIECNWKCHHSLGGAKAARIFCQNNIAQRSRKFPIEIFKTPDRGWGVRSSEFIPRGSFVGLYTGLLIPREAAEKRSSSIEYYFDLDSREMVSERTQENNHGIPKYTVDATKKGNWTRFINHSCGPNLSFYNVVTETLVDDNTPYIAFYALIDIPENTELTFQYSVPREIYETTKKGKRKSVPGEERCLCGAAEGCRRWL